MDEFKKEEDELDEEDEELDGDSGDDFNSEDNKQSSESHEPKDQEHDNSHHEHKHDHDHHDHHLDDKDHHDHHDHKHDHDSDHSHDDKKHDHQSHHDSVSSFQGSESSFQDKSDDNSIKINKDDLWKYAKVVILAFIILGAFAYFRGPVGVTGNVVNDQQPTQLPPAGGQVQVSADDDPFKGDENAPVTIIEFSDYECPFCGRFYSQTLSQLESEYIDTGKVKFVYRDFPLSSIHPQAQKAAEAAECARNQGGDEVYFDYHDGLFDNGVQSGVSGFKQLAADLGLDTDAFDECLDSGEMASEVAKDLADGSSYGVTGTPAFFVNGRLISGAQPFSAFQAAIEAELA